MFEMVVGSNALSVDRVIADSSALGSQVSNLEERAASFQVRNDDDAKEGAKVIKAMKDMEKQVTAFWEPSRDATYKAYKTITDQRKAMLDPLQAAQKIVKKKIDAYVSEKERIEREMQEAIRRSALAQLDKCLDDASQAERRGDFVSAEYSMVQAEIADSIASQSFTGIQVEGTKMKRSWEIDELIPEEVPITVCGITIRVGDKKVVERIVKAAIDASDGTVQIPGVKYRRTYTLSAKN